MRIKNKIKNSYSRVYKGLIFNLSANNNFIFRGFYKYFYKPRQGSLAEFTDIFSRNNPQLTVVQVGANDGFNHDPIHKFIKRDNWRGVLLEPQKEVFDQYLQKLYAKNKGVHTVNAAIDEKDGTRPVYKISFSKARWATGLTSFHRPTLEEMVISDHVIQCAKNEGVELPVNPQDRIKEEQIATISPESLMQQYQIEKIDWLQIDVEGFDYEVIKLFNIEKTRPGVIVFEQYNLTEKVRQECYQHLQDKGYRVKEYGRDALALHNYLHKYERFL